MASFYSNIISEIEKEINSTNLKKVTKDLSAYYRSTKNIASPPDYNNPAYCCAYIYKYASIHTRIAMKYFRKMSTKREIKDILLRKMKIKICCLGGGPGIEIVGICKALAFSPSLHNKVEQVSVLDKFHGWEPFFNSIMSSLADGEDKMLPETFLRKSLRKEFVEVDFQYSLSKKAKKVISQADIVCMIKHSSEFSTEKSACISQVLGKLFKKNALILHIEKSEKISIEAIDYISRSSNFKVVMGPLEGEKFENKFSKSNVETYGCYPDKFSKVSVIGWIKTSTARDAYYNDSFSASHSSLTDACAIGTESDVMDSNIGIKDMDSNVGTKVMESDVENEIVSSDIESEIMHSDTGNEIMHSDMGSEIIHSDTGSEIMHSDTGSEIMHSDTGSEIMHSDTGSEIMHSDTGSEIMHSDMGSEIMHFDTGSEIMHSDTGSEIMHFDMGSEIKHSDTEREIMQSDVKVMDPDVKSKTVDSNEKINYSKIKCKLMDCDVMNSNQENLCNYIVCNKHTQTEDYLFQDDSLKSETEVELAALVEALAELVTVIERFTLKKKI